MKNNDLKNALCLMAEGFYNLYRAFDLLAEGEIRKETLEEEKAEQETVKEELPKEEVKEETPKKEEETNKEETTGETYTLAQLEAKTYAQLKSLAKNLGVSAKGTKQTLIDNIAEHLNLVFGEEELTPDIPVDDTEPIEQEEVDEEELVEEEGETLYDSIVKGLEGYTDEELADILSYIGVSPKGKRQALLAKIVQAVEDGKLEWDDTEEGEELEDEEVETEEEVVEEEIEETTEARKQACLKYRKDLEKQIADGEISHKEILKELKEYYNGKYTSQGKKSDEEEFININCNLIDDEGDIHEFSDPYYIGDDIYCCGQKLKEVDEDYYCEICGTTYTN